MTSALLLSLALNLAGPATAGATKEPVDYIFGKLTVDTQTKAFHLSEGVDFRSGDLHVTGERGTVEFAPPAQPGAASAPAASKSPAKRKAAPSLPGLGGQAVQRFVVEGKVHVEKGGRTADGERAVFDAQAQTLSLSGPSQGALASPGPVLREGRETLLGESVLWRLGPDEVEVLAPRLSLRRSLEGKAQAPTRIEAQRLLLDPDRRTLRFTGDVRLLREDLLARAPRMLASYDGGGEVQAVRLEGGVKLTQGTRQGSSKTAVYEGQGRTVKLLGDPQLVDRGDVLYGEVIELFLDTKEVTVSKARGRLQPDGHRSLVSTGKTPSGPTPAVTP